MQQLTLRLQASTTDQEAVNVLLLSKILAVLATDTATVEDAGLISNLVANVGPEPLADGLVHLLGLLNRGDLASANGPDGLVGDDNFGPIINLGLDRSKLLLDYRNSLAGFTLLERLAAAPDDIDAALGGELGLGSNYIVRLAQDGPPLRVTEDGPADAAVLELRDADLAREGTVGLVKDVLSSNFDVVLEMLAHEEEIQGWRGNYNLCSTQTLRLATTATTSPTLHEAYKQHTDVGVQLCLVEVLHDGFDGLNGPIPRVWGNKSSQLALRHSTRVIAG